MTDLPSIPALEPVSPAELAKEPYDVALVIDNVVYQTFNVDGQTAARFLAQPTFIQYAADAAKVGYHYDPATGKFFNPHLVGTDPTVLPEVTPSAQ